MNRIIAVVSAFILCLNTHAQETFPFQQDNERDHNHEGRLFLGGAITFWRNTEDKTTTFDFCPEVGYLFNDTWGIGLLLGYEYEQEKEEGLTTRLHSFKVSPFGRYYYYHRGPFNLFLDGGFGVDFGKTTKEGVSENRRGFEIGLRPGACADLTEGLCLCLRMGFIGYRNNYYSGEEPHIGHDGFGLRFAPEELMIGLELEF